MASEFEQGFGKSFGPAQQNAQRQVLRDFLSASPKVTDEEAQKLGVPQAAGMSRDLLSAFIRQKAVKTKADQPETPQATPIGKKLITKQLAKKFPQFEHLVGVAVTAGDFLSITQGKPGFSDGVLLKIVTQMTTGRSGQSLQETNPQRFKLLSDERVRLGDKVIFKGKKKSAASSIDTVDAVSVEDEIGADLGF